MLIYYVTMTNLYTQYTRHICVNKINKLDHIWLYNILYILNKLVVK